MKLMFREFVIEYFAKKIHDEQMNGIGGGDGRRERAMHLLQAHTLGAQGEPLESVPAFADLFKKFEKHCDPDYATYLELKKKFND